MYQEADMTDRHDPERSENSIDSAADVARLKSETELEILKLEAEELQTRVNRSRKQFTGRYFIEAIIGGAVAGALFVSWFTGFYSPSIEIEKERLVFAKERETERFERKLERIRDENEQLLLKHRQFVLYLTEANENLVNLIQGFKDRVQIQTDKLNNKYEESDPYLAGYKLYLEKESDTLDKIVGILKSEISEGRGLAEKYRDAVDRLDNTRFTIQIVYNYGYLQLAELAANALEDQEYQVIIESWQLFKEDGDPPMSTFFPKGPVLWFDQSHERTKDKIEYIQKALVDVFPDNMTMQTGGTRHVPGISWSPPGEYRVQLWIFRKG